MRGNEMFDVGSSSAVTEAQNSVTSLSRGKLVTIDDIRQSIGLSQGQAATFRAYVRRNGPPKCCLGGGIIYASTPVLMVLYEEALHLCLPEKEMPPDMEANAKFFGCWSKISSHDFELRMKNILHTWELEAKKSVAGENGKLVSNEKDRENTGTITRKPQHHYAGATK